MTFPFASLRVTTKVAAGVAAALVCLELAVRPFASVQQPPWPDPALDVLAGPLIESRELDEGVGTSHFTAGGSRWTGTQPVEKAPVVVIIGDSYVVAREVRDDATMGAWVERFAREANHPVAVRQYGWRAARPAQYVHYAPAVVGKWSPSDVVVVLEASDFDSRALTDTVPTPAARTELIDRSSLVMLMRLRRAKLQPRLTQTANRWRTRLGLVATAPTEAVIEPDETPTTEDAPAVAPQPVAATTPAGNIEEAVVRALATSYGERLSIVYVANTRLKLQAEPDEHETRLAAASSALEVRFASTRSPMVERLREGVITRGFPTTTPGSGHLNVHGHEMMGRIIWSMIQDRAIPARR